MATIEQVTRASYQGRFDDQMSAGAEKAAEAMRKLGSAVVETDQVVTRSTRTADSWLRSADPMTAASQRLTRAQQQQAAAQQALNNDLAAGGERQAAAERALAAMAARVQKAKDDLQALERANAGAGAAITGVGTSARLTTRELQQLSPQIADVGVTLLGGMNPLLVLVQQGPQITDAVGGIGRAFTLLRAALATPTAAIVATGAALVAVSVVAEGQARALANLSNQLRTTRDDYEALAVTTEAAARRAAATTSIGTGDARLAGGTIAGARNFTGNQAELTNLIALSGRLATVMGTDVPTAAQKLAEALDRPRQAAEALAASGLRTMDEGLVRTIRSLENQGRVAEAARLTIDAYNRAIGEVAKTPLQRATEELSQAFARLWQQLQPVVVAVGTVLVQGIALVVTGIERLVSGIASLAAGLRDTSVARFLFGDVPAPSADPSASGETPLQRQLRLAREANPRFLQQRDNREQYGAARDALAGATGDDAALLRSRMQELNEAYRGMQGPVADYLKGLRDQVTISRQAEGAAQELQQATQAVAEAGGDAAAQAEARRLVQERLTNQFVNFITVQNQAAIGTRAQAIAMAQGATAADDVRISYEAQAQALRYAKAGTEEYQLIVDILTGQLTQQRDAQQALNEARSITTQEQQLALIQRETDLVGAGVVVRERELAVLRERQRILNEPGADINSDQSQARLANAGRIAEATQALQRQQSAFTELQRVGEQAFDRIGSAITQAFANGTLQTLKFSNIAKAVVSEVAQAFLRLAVINPIKNYAFGGNSPVLSLAGIGGTLGGAAGVANAGSTAGALNQAGQSAALYQAGRYGNLGTVFTTPGGVANTGIGFLDAGLNTPIMSLAPEISNASAASFQGLVDGSLGTSLTLGNAIGGAAGIAGGAYGIYSGIQKGGIGGAAQIGGGAISATLGAATIAAAFNPAIYAMLASLGPYGWAAAAALAIAGALLPGEKPSSKGQLSRINLDTEAQTYEGLGGKRFSQDNRDAASNTVNSIADMARQIGDKLGGARIGGNVAVGVTSSRGSGPGSLYLEIGTQKGQYTNDEAGSKQLADAAAQMLLNEFKVQGRAQGDYASILNASGDLETLSKNLDFYSGTYKQLGETVASAGAFENQMKALVEPFNAAIAKAQELSLSTDRLTQAREREAQKLQEQRDRQVDTLRDTLLGREIASGLVEGNVYQLSAQVQARAATRAAAEEIASFKQQMIDLAFSTEDVASAIERLTAVQAAEAEQRAAEAERLRAYNINDILLSIQERAAAVSGSDWQVANVAQARASAKAAEELIQLQQSLTNLGLTTEEITPWITILSEAQQKEIDQLAASAADTAAADAAAAAARQSAAGSALSVIANLADYAASLTTTAAGSGTAMDRLEASQRRFNAVFGAAQAGDANSIAGLQASAEAYRVAAREVFGSGEGFAEALTLIGQRIGAISDLGSEALTASFYAENARENTDRIVDSQEDLKAEIKALRASLELALSRPAAA